MKKMILAALVAVASLSANAQIWVGGEVGFTADKTTNNGTKFQNSATFSLLPEIGYTINDKFDFAVLIGMQHGNARNINEEYETNYNSFILKPYIRYKFAKAGDFTFFVDGGFGYKYNHWSEYEDNRIDWSLGLNPGFSYSISDKVSLVAHVGDLSYTFSKAGDWKYNKFNMGVSGNNLTFGAYVSF